MFSERISRHNIYLVTKKPRSSRGLLQWTEPGMIRRPKDFQSFALPAELSVLGLTSIYEDSPVV